MKPFIDSWTIYSVDLRRACWPELESEGFCKLLVHYFTKSGADPGFPIGVGGGGGNANPRRGQPLTQAFFPKMYVK